MPKEKTTLDDGSIFADLAGTGLDLGLSLTAEPCIQIPNAQKIYIGAAHTGQAATLRQHASSRHLLGRYLSTSFV
jgi:hypothetical protein